MRLFITGGTGLIGSNLIHRLLKDSDRTARYEIYVLTRDINRARKILNHDNLMQNSNHSIVYINLYNHTNQDFQQLIDNSDIVINLAGAPISRLPWTQKYKKIMMSSRIGLTKKISNAISRSNNPPKKFLTGSAIGIYGSYPDSMNKFTEDSEIIEGNELDFLQKMAIEWEKAAEPAVHKSDTIFLRTGLIFEKNAPLWKKLSLSYKFKIALDIKPGTQILSWISLEDYLEILLNLIFPKNMSDQNKKEIFKKFSGPINLVSPNPISWTEFSSHLQNKYSTFLKIPIYSKLLEIPLGDSAKILNSGQFVTSDILNNSGYKHRYSDFSEVLKELT